MVSSAEGFERGELQMYGFTLIFILAFIGGVIAYIGDKIGMKVGRKRLTLFGLRPKYTGIIITIFTGIFISVASIVILTIASDDVRTALFEMKEIQETLAANQQQLDQSIQAMSQMEADLQTLIIQRDAAAADLAEAQELYAELEQMRAQLQLEYDQLLAEYEELSLDYSELYMFANWIRLGNVAFRAEQIIYAQVVEASDNLEENYSRLYDVLKTADRIAYQSGARVDSDSESAIIIPQDAVDFAALYIQQEQGLFVVRVLSETNTVVGQPVKAYLGIIKNELIFPKDTVLEETVVDLDAEPDVDKEILELLNRANAVAVREGMITSIGGGAVEVDGNEFMNAIAQAEASSGKIKIQAKALEDTFAAAGPVKIKLDIIQD